MFSLVKPSFPFVTTRTKSLLGSIGAAALLAPAALGDAGQTECEVSVTETPQSIPLPYGCHTLGAAINSSVDSDAFSFTGAIGDEVRIVVDQISNNCLGIRIDVFGPAGFTPQAVATQPSCQFGDVSHSLVLPLTLDIAGAYVIVLSDPNNDQTGLYTLQIERILPEGPAPALGYGLNQSSTLSPTTDHDFLSFFGQAGSAVRINVDQTSNNCVGVRLEVFDPAGDSILNVACQPSCQFGDISCSFFRDLSLSLTGHYLLVLSDPGVDQTGTLNISVNCILGCPPLAGSTQRNGSGLNPLVFDSTCPPVIGGTWRGVVDCSGHSEATKTAVVFYGRALNPGTPIPYGELLVDTNARRFGCTFLAAVEADDNSRHEIPIPRMASLAGLQIASQAAILSGSPVRIELTNAVDMVVGY